MFKATPPAPVIPSKSQSIRPEVISDVNSKDEIRFLLPSFLGFVDGRQSYLKMSFKMGDVRGSIVPDPAAGIQSCLRNIIIRDGTNTATLATYEDYNLQVASLRNYTAQTVVDHKRALFEGVQPTATEEKSLFFGAQPTLSAVVGETTRANRETQTVEAYIQLDSGLLADQILPVALMDGIRMEITTEDALRACKLLDLTLSEESPTLTPTEITDTTFTPAAQEHTYTTGHFSETSRFAIGDKLYLSKADGSDELSLGFVTGLSDDGTGKLVVHFSVQTSPPANPIAAGATYPADSKMYFKVADRQQAQSYIDETGTTVSVAAPDYTMSNIEFLAMTCSPPTAYVEGMMRKSMGAGVELSFLGVELHRFNQVNQVGVTQIQIPTLAKEGKSIITVPVPVTAYRDLSRSSFDGVPDDATSYQWVIGSELVPNRQVPLSRYSQSDFKAGQAFSEGMRRTEPLHSVELMKSISNVGRPVYSLQKIADHFAIGRALNRYGQITPLDDISVSLRVEYDSSAAEQKVFNSFVYKLVRIMVKDGAVMVVS